MSREFEFKKFTKEMLAFGFALEGRQEGAKVVLKEMNPSSRRYLMMTLMALQYWITEIEVAPAPFGAANLKIDKEAHD